MVTLVFETFLTAILREYSIYNTIDLHIHWGMRALLAISNPTEIARSLIVTGSHTHCKSANISETVQDRDVVVTGH